jgi:hypothetical protein
MVTRLPQPQGLHTSGLNTPAVTRQGLLSGWKQGTPKYHSGADRWNIWILYSTTSVWAVPHTTRQQEIVSEQNPRTYGSVTQAYWKLYQSTRLTAGRCFTNSVPSAGIHVLRTLETWSFMSASDLVVLFAFAKLRKANISFLFRWFIPIVFDVYK